MSYAHVSAIITNGTDTLTISEFATVYDFAELNAEWRKTYRPIALEMAAERGMPVTKNGMRVTFTKIPFSD
jgi:hypothetical protein